MSPTLLWFGVLGAPAAWALQLVVNYSLEEWFACAPSTSATGDVLGTDVPTAAIAVSALLALVAVAAGVVSVVAYRRITNGASPEVVDRKKWMALAGIMNSVLYLIIILASFGPPLLLDVCAVSP